MAETANVQERQLTLADLTEYFAKGSKPKEAFRVGAEHEKFGFYLGSHKPVPYEGDKGVHARSAFGVAQMPLLMKHLKDPEVPPPPRTDGA